MSVPLNKTDDSLDEPGSARKIPPQTLAAIATATAKALQNPSVFTDEHVAVDAAGQSISLWSTQAAKRDVLGWILISAQKVLNDQSRGHGTCYRASVLINNVVLNEVVIERRRRSLIEIADTDGRIAAITALNVAAAALESGRVDERFVTVEERLGLGP